MVAPRPFSAALLFGWCGAVVFVLSLLYFLHSYLIRFGRSTADADAVNAVAIDAAHLTIFALPHSVLARDSIKLRVRRLVPPALERSLYTWTASVLFLLVCALWQFVSGQAYRLSGIAAGASYTVQLLGIVVAGRSSTRLDV